MNLPFSIQNTLSGCSSQWIKLTQKAAKDSNRCKTVVASQTESTFLSSSEIPFKRLPISLLITNKSAEIRLNESNTSE